MPPFPDQVNRVVLQEVGAPAGWTAVLLQQQLPVEDEQALAIYREAVDLLMSRVPVFQQPMAEDVFLLFAQCRPGKEIKLIQENGRWWLPEFGVGVWLHQDPPTTWTREEFEAAAPGTLRPVIDRVVHIQREGSAQRSAWQKMLGSGALLRIYESNAGGLMKASTAALQSSISDPSLTSFPFYMPLLRADALSNFSPAYNQSLADHLPGVSAYVRESVEDGGTLFLLRQEPQKFWANLQEEPLQLRVSRITLSDNFPFLEA